MHAVNNKCADQTARMRRLVCAFIVRKQQSQGFSRRGPYGVEAQASWPPPGNASDTARMCSHHYLLYIPSF